MLTGVRTVLRAGGLYGSFGGRETIGGMSVGIQENSVCKLLNPGNTNGSAALGVVANVLHPADNGVLFSKRR